MSRGLWVFRHRVEFAEDANCQFSITVQLRIAQGITENADSWALLLDSDSAGWGGTWESATCDPRTMP